MNPADVIVRPIVTEKSTALSAEGQYVFEVRVGSTKHAVARAVEAMFRVEVAAVNVMNVRGKPRRYGRFQGRRAQWRKAVVTLDEGQSIEIFPGT